MGTYLSLLFRVRNLTWLESVLFNLARHVYFGWGFGMGEGWKFDCMCHLL